MLDGVSKDFNMTAWRIGWAAADRAVIEHIGKAHMYNGTLASAFAQAGVIALLNDHAGAQAYVRRCAGILAERGRLAADALSRIPGLGCVPPQGGWWFLLDHRALEPDDGAFAHALLEQANVAVTPMGTWGPSTATGPCGSSSPTNLSNACARRCRASARWLPGSRAEGGTGARPARIGSLAAGSTGSGGVKP